MSSLYENFLGTGPPVSQNRCIISRGKKRRLRPYAMLQNETVHNWKKNWKFRKKIGNLEKKIGNLEMICKKFGSFEKG